MRPQIGRIFLTIFLLMAVVDAAAEPPKSTAVVGRLVTHKWMRKLLSSELKKIEDRLTVIEENQKKILEGQDKLSEEHQQLRRWIHHR